jgi:hypothetical protein
MNVTMVFKQVKIIYCKISMYPKICKETDFRIGHSRQNHT